MSISVLCIGDVVGKPGRAVLESHLPYIQRELNVDFTIANI
jgi:calcineurin-like phosphoesterase